jgi:hypothetical protein
MAPSQLCSGGNTRLCTYTIRPRELQICYRHLFKPCNKLHVHATKGAETLGEGQKDY